MSRLGKSLKVNRKTFFNPKGWLDWDFLSIETKNLYRSVKDNFDIPKAEPGEATSFDEAMMREGITDADLIKITRRYSRFCIFFLILGFVLFVYGFFVLFSYGIFSGWVLGLAISALFFSQAFRYDFWNMQIKQRRLDLTYDDWKRHYLGDNKGKKS